jgi:hypothetical protein
MRDGMAQEQTEELKILKDNGEKVVASVPNQDIGFVAKLNDLVVTTMINTFVREKKTNARAVLDSAEKFGRLVFSECVGKKDSWTPYEWVVACICKIFNRQGTGVTFTVSHDNEVRAIIHKCPTPERARISPEVACAFSWGYVRGLWLSAFPEGEALMKCAMAMGCPTCEFVFTIKKSKADENAMEHVMKILHSISGSKM